MLALYVYTPLTLANALVAAGKPDEAKTYFDAAIELAPDAGFAKELALSEATATGDVLLLSDPTLPLSAALRTALLKGNRAAASGDAGAKAQAIQALLALPDDQQTDAVAILLAKFSAPIMRLSRLQPDWRMRNFMGPIFFGIWACAKPCAIRGSRPSRHNSV